MRGALLLIAAVLTGCVASPTATVTTAGEADLHRVQDDPTWVPPPLHERLHFQYQGRTVTGACIRDGGACDEPTVGSAENTLYPVAFEGAANWVHVRVDWTPTSQLTTEMWVSVLACAGGDCAGARELGADRGVAPRDFNVTLETLAVDETLVIRVDNANAGFVPFVYSLEQPFQVEGAVDLKYIG